MSNRKRTGSIDQHHQRAAALHDSAAHAHLVAAETRGKQDHPTGHELSRTALEHSRQAFEHTEASNPDSSKGHAAAAHTAIAVIAHGLWEARGCPEGSPEEDWYRATQRMAGNGERA